MASTVITQDGQAVASFFNSLQKLVAECERALHEVYWKHPPWFLHRVKIQPTILLHTRAGPMFMVHSMMLFTVMRQKFPREVRDLIYAWIWDDEELEEHRGLMRHTMGSTCRTCVDPLALHCRHHLSLPYYVRFRLVGTDMARELVESWYSAAATYPEKELLLAYQPTDVKDIICKDTFNVGLDPAQILRKLDINTSVSDFVLPGDATARGWVRSVEHRREVIAEPLLKLQHKEGFKLTIKVHQEHIRLNHWREVFDALREPVRVMKAEGAIVKATFWYDKQEYGSTSVSYDIVDAILQPEEEWRPKAVAFLDAQPVIENIHRLYRDENKPDFDTESDIYFTQEELDAREEQEREIMMYGMEGDEPRHDWESEYLTTGTLRHEKGVCDCPECEPNLEWRDYNFNNDNEYADEDEYADHGWYSENYELSDVGR